MKISKLITDKYKLRIPPTVYYDLLADVQELEDEQEPIKKLVEQIIQLQNRCHALTHGLMCNFCPYECEHKAEVEPQESGDKE